MKTNIRYSFLLILSLCFFNINVFGQAWVKVSAGGFFSVALDSKGKIYTCGANSYGQLGTGDTSNRLSYTQVGTDSDWADISAGGWHVLALKRNGKLYAWGSNQYAQSGGSVPGNILTPTQVGTDSDWLYICGGVNNSFAIKKDSTAWVWGANSAGQVGNGNENTTYIPYNINNNKWISICGGHIFTMALRNDGTIWSWGNNGYGMLGNGTYTSTQTPTQVGTDNNWASITAGYANAIAIKKDGSIWGWGRNINGELGLGDTVIRLQPTRIGTDNNWRQAYSGPLYTFAIKADSSLYAWGSDIYGQLGDGAYNNNKLLPEQIGQGAQWLAASPSRGIFVPLTNGKNEIEGYHTLALKPGEQYICATGVNNAGQFGNGGTFYSTIFSCTGAVSGIEQSGLKYNTFSIYPNPTTGKTNISIESQLPGFNELTLSDINGKIIYSDHHFKNSSQIDISAYPNGI